MDEATGIDLNTFSAVVSVATRIMTVIRERKKKMSTMLLIQQEKFRAQMAKAKELRSERLSQLVAQHRHVVNIVAMYFGIEPKEVEDGIVDFDSHVVLLEDLFTVGGRKAILLQYYETDPPPPECGRHLPNVPKDFQMLRVVITDGTVVPAVGKCVIAYRIKDVEIEARNVNEEINFVYFEISPGETNVISQMYEVLQRANRPILHTYTDWGKLLITPEGIQARDDFLSDVDVFILFLEFTKSDLSKTVSFKIPEELWDGVLNTPENIRRSSRSPQIVRKVEAVTSCWGRKICEVLTQARHLRRESSDAGPLLELYTWRCLMTKITSIIEHLKSRHCKNFVQCLVVSKSRDLKKWKEVDKRITNAYNEATDNVRYLYSVQNHLDMLYRRNPNEIATFVPALLHAIRMVFGVSRFYNDTERASALMVKVTNQMINSCRAYLTKNNTINVWKDAKSVMINKMKDCMELFRIYHTEFQRIKKEMAENEDEPSVEVSEMFVFGKFETFVARLVKISDVLQTVLMYSILESSKIEGIDVYAAMFHDAFAVISSKSYDVLDFRNLNFNDDYTIFKQSVMAAEKQMRDYIGQMLSEVPDIYIALRLLHRLDKLNLYCLRVDKRYIEVMDMYQAQLLQVRDYYNEFRQKPHIPNNMPPVSGRVVWIRQLYNRIEEPMEIFKAKEEVMHCDKARKIIKQYNALSTVLVHYEMIYHEAWFNNAPQQVRSCLTLPLLIKNPRTCRLSTNFDSYILETIRETENLWKLDLSAPDTAQIVTYSKKIILSAYEAVQSLKNWNDEMRASINKVFIPLMYAQLKVIDKAFSPALSVITWTSLEIPKFIADLTKDLTNTAAFVKETADIKDARIDIVLENIEKATFVELPASSVETSAFFERNSMFRRIVGKDIQVKSKRAELSTIELINKFIRTIKGLTDEERYGWLDPELALKPVSSNSLLLSADEDAAFIVNTDADIDLPKTYRDCNELFGFFNTNIFDALIKATKRSLEKLKQRVELVRDGTQPAPLILAELTLQIPLITVMPSIEELQTEFNRTALTIIDVHRSVQQWGQRSVAPGAEDPGDAEGPETMIGKTTYFKTISEHKDVLRILQALESCLILLKPDIEELEQHYKSYEYLWPEDREEQVKAFVDTQPIVQEIREEFLKYQNLLIEIDHFPETHIIGPLEIKTEKLKLGLSVEAEAWKHLLGQYFCAAYRVKLNEIVEFIKDKGKQLEKSIENLDDVRLAMACLDEVRQNYIRIDMDLDLIEDAYQTFAYFNVEVPTEDVENSDSLRLHFQEMLDSSMDKQQELCEVQGPFKQELIDSAAGLKAEIEEFDKDFDEAGPMVEGITPKEASERVLLFQARLDGLWERFEIASDGERLFGLEVNEYPILYQRKKELALLNKLYGLYTIVMRSIDGYCDLPWGDVDIEVINDEISDFQNRCRRLPKGMKDWEAYIDLKTKIDDFLETLPLLEMMADKAMKDRHWKRLSALTGYEFDVDSENFTLQSVMRAPLLQYKDDVEDICISAVKEKDIEAKLKQVIADWSQVELTFARFKSRGELLLKAQDAKDTISALEDSLMVLGSLLSNRYNAPFKKDIQTWVQKLSNSSEVLDNWMQTQNLWLYLEAVFVGGDIAKQLPAEAKRFAGIDKTWMKIMQRAHEIGNIVECCSGDETMMTILPHMLENLEACQKSLSGYLESKRLIFPRFFFVSDPALLEILGQASDTHSIQHHLLAIFDNTAKAEFSDKDYDRIIAVYSREEEKIELETTVLCVGGVEIWLGALLKSILESVNGVIGAAYFSLLEPDFDLLDLEYSQPAQVGLIAIQFLWTMNAEMALKMSKMDKTIMRRTNDSFLDMLNLLIEQTVKELSRYDRTKFETLVTIHVHQRDIFDELFRLKIKTPTAFDWLKQSRFYFDEEKDETLIQITDVDFIYQNEFLGCTERLVITPLTDRCYITLSQAIGMNMGGAPAGPAGTGKTETTKDMGRALGKYVVVFNCSDQMDFRGLGRIYKGLAQSGSWGCFDEFNRIELPVLSVAAQQIAIVLQARKERKAKFIFSDGDVVSLNIEFGLFLTMNPGYAGRQELPENLKINFRTVAMMVPDRQIIIRVKLASCGFKDNITLARKFYTLYKLCEEQLSKQVHYDFGLRNILSVLRTLGAQKRAHPLDTEDATVMRVLREMNLSKLIDEDETLFVSLIDDMFPGMKPQATSHKEFQRIVASACEDLGLINHPEWNLKIVQFYETSLVRHGLMALGPTGAGKTTMMQTLMKALTDMGTPHREMRMNPKAITAPQMFGRLDVATNDWTDGIFSTLWRRALKVEMTKMVWIVLDGPVDAVWIENLNSVLDDNKTLTLANGDRITMAPNSKLIFEPDNVDNASPATISRMGMVFMSASSLRWMPIMERWLLSRTPQEVTTFRELFGRIYNDIELFVKVHLHPKMNLLESMYIRQCIDLLQGLMDKGEEVYVFSDSHLEHLFLFALMWSHGSVLELDDREVLQTMVLQHKSKLDWPKIREGESIFEYVVIEDGDWQHWSERIEEYEYPKDSVPEYSSILVPNVDNVRSAYLIEVIAKQDKAVLLIGEQGTAKTVMIKNFMSKYDIEYHLCKGFTFSSATTPNMVQRVIESYVDKRVGLIYGPPAGKKMTVFVDDINMPIINEWGDQVTNEIVRQVMEMKGFYSLDKPGDFYVIQDLQFLAAMIHPGGGHNDIPPRLKRQFNVFNCTLPSNNSMDKIFSTIAEGYFCEERFKGEIVGFVPKLVPLTRKVWQQTKVKMLPTPAKFHYIFNLRDLSRIWEGILYIKDPELPGVEVLLKLWVHECSRIISDRFINQQDRDWFMDNLKKTAKKELGDDFDEYFPSEVTYFVDFLREPPEATGEEDEEISLEAPKIYEEMPGWDYMKNKFKTLMGQYNDQIIGTGMDMVFFHDCMVHLMVISRIIRLPRGNALLVGVGGSGKQSLTRLASFTANYLSFQITMTRSYNAGNLCDDLKYLYKVSGHQGKGISFIFTDNEIKEEGFLEYLNNVLSVGEVANLFARDELDEITSALVPIMKKEHPKIPPTPDLLYDYFISRARSNLHVVLCFSPVGEKFQSRAMKFPGLISGCTVDWFFRWPSDALVEVSEHFITPFQIVCTPEIKIKLTELMGGIHDGVAGTCEEYFERFRRQTHVTPKSYLSFIDGYKKLYNEKYDNIAVMAKGMSMGLAKLVEAAASVDVLKVELVEMDKVITVANAKAEKVLKEVTVSAQAAEKVKAEVEIVKDRAINLVNMIAKEKAKADVKLEAALPALQAAEAALQTIKPADIATVRKLGKPPYLITLIMDAVLILFQRGLDSVQVNEEKEFLQASWVESLKMMADTRFLSNLVTYPKDKMNAELIDLLQPYLNYPLYTLENAKTTSASVAGLMQWTAAMSSYYAVNKEVMPLKANLIVQQAKLDNAQNQLQDAEATLKAKEEELQGVQEEFNVAMASKQKVLDEANKCQAKMTAAQGLIDGLAEERIRWTEQSAQFKAEIERLVGDVLLLSGFLSYTGPFNQEFRAYLMQTWINNINIVKIPLTANLNIIENLTDSATIGEWNLQGLPSDELSIQNGIIATRAPRYPLMIDPQGQGKSWIKLKEKPNGLIMTTLNDKYFRNYLEDCVSNGVPLLIVDVGEELDPAMDNVLEKNYFKVGTGLKVKVGDKEVDVSSDFCCYITTKLSNPSYTPEVAARTSMIDFAVTLRGLEDQLLGRVILTEKYELEAERTNLITTVTANKRKMKELEENLLIKLTTVEGSLVDDPSVLEVLNTTTATAEDVREKLKVANITEIKINAAREEFRPVAARGSVLYFLVVDMSQVNPMYQTSLVQFLERFDVSMARSEKSPVTAKRMHFIIEYLTFEVYRYVARGLYEEHKFLFTLLVTLKIDIQRGVLSFEELMCFIKGGAALDLNECPPKPCKWITDISWLNLVQLSNLQNFQDILQSITDNDKLWKAWFDKEAPEEEVIPDGYDKLDVLHRLMLVRSFCPDRTLDQARKYIANSLGSRYNNPVITDFAGMLEESVSLTPMLCLLSLGSDPTSTILNLAKKLGFSVQAISMGQGQEVHANRMLKECVEDGGWLLLQNTHLSVAYMDDLFVMLSDMTEYNEDFRVWITAEINKKYPIALLQISIKYTNEPPSGMRAGLMGTYSRMGQDHLDYTDAVEYLPLVYAISFLHTVVQERRKFGPLGWNIPYEFNSADWYASCLFVQNHLDEIDPKKGISWSTLRYMLGEVQYGGRVTDDYDKRLLNTFTRVWFKEEMFLDDFEFYKGYKIVRFKWIAEYLEYFEAMAPVDPPQVYGLHANANISYQSNVTRGILDTILEVQPKESSGGGGETRESMVSRLALDMLSRIPKDFDPFECKQRLKIMGALNPMNIFLKQEIDRMQKVISTVRKTLKDLLLAIEGTIVMNEALRDALDNIYDAKVPNSWKRGSWLSSTIGFWFTELIDRSTQFSSWIFHGRPPAFWMTGFFNCQGFLTAMRQEVARRHKGWSLDGVALYNEVLKINLEDAKKPPDEGVYIYGLFLDGGGWDRKNNMLCEQPSKVLFIQLPIVYVYAINSTAPKSSALYEVPVYKKPRRTDLNFITPLWLPSDQSPDHWIMRGVAMLCDIK